MASSQPTPLQVQLPERPQQQQQQHIQQEVILHRLCHQLSQESSEDHRIASNAPNQQQQHPSHPLSSTSPSSAALSSSPLKHILALPTYQRYLSSLSGMHLQDLRAQPDQLDQELERISHAMGELCLAEYKAFITADATQRMLKSLMGDVSKGLDMVLEGAPKVRLPFQLNALLIH
jgi:hypothetical protein